MWLWTMKALWILMIELLPSYFFVFFLITLPVVESLTFHEWTLSPFWKRACAKVSHHKYSHWTNLIEPVIWNGRDEQSRRWWWRLLYSNYHHCYDTLWWWWLLLLLWYILIIIIILWHIIWWLLWLLVHAAPLLNLKFLSSLELPKS